MPNKLWTLYDSEASDITVDFKSDSSERDDIWWKQQPLINLDLSSNSLAVISPKIGDLCELTVLDVSFFFNERAELSLKLFFTVT